MKKKILTKITLERKRPIFYFIHFRKQHKHNVIYLLKKYIYTHK